MKDKLNYGFHLKNQKARLRPNFLFALISILVLMLFSIPSYSEGVPEINKAMVHTDTIQVGCFKIKNYIIVNLYGIIRSDGECSIYNTPIYLFFSQYFTNRGSKFTWIDPADGVGMDYGMEIWGKQPELPHCEVPGDSEGYGSNYALLITNKVSNYVQSHSISREGYLDSPWYIGSMNEYGEGPWLYIVFKFRGGTTKQGPNPHDPNVSQGDDVNVTNGNMYLSFNDFSMNGIGVPTKITRTYNSQSVASGCFGFGWTFTYGVTLYSKDTWTKELQDEYGALKDYSFDSNYASYISPLGDYSKLEHLSNGIWKLTKKNGTVYEFNDMGKLTTIIDRNNNKTVLHYTDNLLTDVTDSSGRKLNFNYTDGKITTITDFMGRQTQYFYDENNNLVKVTDQSGNSTSYAYDDRHFLVKVTKPNGNHLYFTYDDGSCRCIGTKQDNNLQSYSFVYSPSTTEMIDGNGHKTTFKYNAEKGVVTSITDALGKVTTTTWDDNINRIQTVNPNGRTINYEYDSKGNVIKITNPMGGVTSFTYEPNYSFVTSVKDPSGNMTSYCYDAKGNITSITNAAGRITSFGYDNYGNMISQQNPVGDPTTYQYNGYGNLITSVDSLKNSTSFGYDLLGNLLSSKDPKGRVTCYNYDILNRLIQITYPNGTKDNYTYDAEGNCLSFTDQNGGITKYTYDNGDRLIKKTDPMSHSITYTYDCMDNLLSVTDANSKTTRYVYDGLNRLAKVITPLGKSTLYTYDNMNNITSTTDANNHKITFLYDDNNNLLKKMYPDGTSVSYTYDANGNRLSMLDSTGIRTYAYDSLNHLITTKGPDSNDIVTYSYGVLGNKILMTNQDGRNTFYSYDTLGRLIKVTDSLGNEMQYNYDCNGNLIEKKYPNSIIEKCSYDNMNRVISSSSFINSYLYKYNPMGMKTSATIDKNISLKYTYDYANELTYEKRSVNNRMIFAKSFSFDSAGNRIYMFHDQNAANYNVKENYTVNADNSLTSEIKKQQGDNSTCYYTYDNNGNLVTKNQVWGNSWFGSKRSKTYYAYDYENRLVKITYPNGSTSEYVYDGDGKRIAVKEDGKIRKYLYDGLNVIIEKGENNNTILSYVREPYTNGGVGGIISMNKYDTSGNDIIGTYYYHYDGSGNVAALSTSNGRVEQKYGYDAYGSIISQYGTTQSNYLFSTKEFSPKSGLYYFGARYYDPKVSRWVTQDPLGMFGGSLNLYQYCLNNPVNLCDPYGYYWFRQDWQEPGKVGREDTIVRPKGPVSQFIEKYVPAGYTFGEMHDDFVDAAKGAGVPDWLANVPSMLPVYGAAQIAEMLRTLRILEQQQRKAQNK